MRLIIVGAGRTAIQLTESLSRLRKFEMTVIEIESERAQWTGEHVDCLVIHGDGTHPEILEKAKIHQAHAIVCLTGSDAINTVIAMLAAQRGVDKIVVRLKDPALRAACEQAGATSIIMPKATAAQAIVDAIGGAHRIELATGDLRLTQLPAHSHHGKTVGELDLPDGLVPVAIMRDDDALLARADLRLEESDEIILAAEDDRAARRAREHFEQPDDDGDE